MKRAEAVLNYAGIVTAILVFIIYLAAMWKFTDKDMLEILVSYVAFLLFPAFAVPYLIMGEEDENPE